MRIASPTALWKVAASSPNRVVKWSFFVRKTSDITLALTDLSVPWVDVTEYVRQVPGMHQALEFQVGDFTADSIKFIIDNIAWWKANVFNTSAGQVIELMVTLTIGLQDSVMATDTCYLWSGLLEQSGSSGPQATESADETSVTAYTYDELGDRLSASAINVPNTTDDWINLYDSLIQIYKSQPSGYDLSQGSHGLQYEYDPTSGTATVSLDGGLAYKIVPDYTGTAEQISTEIIIGNAGVNTIGNGAKPRLDTQRAYVRFISLPLLNVTIKFGVETTGGRPVIYYKTISVKKLLKKAYGQNGISSVNFGDLTLPSYDSGDRVCFIGRPPEDGTSEGFACRGVAGSSSGTVYVSVGGKVYSYDPSTGVYTLLFTVGTGTILRIWYDERNNDIWVLYTEKGNDYADQLFRYQLPNTTPSNNWTLHCAATAPGCDIIDYNYAGASWKYGLIVADVHGDITQYNPDGSTSTIVPESVGTTLNFQGAWNPFRGMTQYVVDDVTEYGGLCYRAKGTVPFPDNSSTYPPTNGTYWEQASYGATSQMLEAHSGHGYIAFMDASVGATNQLWGVNSSGTWINLHGTVASYIVSDYTTQYIRPGNATFDFNNNRFYFYSSDKKQIQMYDSGGTRYILKDYDDFEIVPSPDGNWQFDDCSGMVTDGATYIWATVLLEGKWMLCNIDTGVGLAGTFSFLDEVSNLRFRYISRSFSYASGFHALDPDYASGFYGLDADGNLWTLAATCQMVLQNLDYSDLTLRNTIQKALKTYFLIGKISSIKTANVYKRIDGSGNLINSGNSVAISIDNDEDIVESKSYLKKCALISISGQTVSDSYDGTNFGAQQQPGDVVLSLSVPWLPDALVRDLLVYLWPFCNADHDILTLPVVSGNAEYEIFDAAAVAFSTTKIQKTATGIIMDETINSDASLTLKVLF